MAFKVGDVVQLKSGGARMIVSKLFKTPEGSEMVASVLCCPPTLSATSTSPWDWCRGTDAMMESGASDCGDLLRFVLEQAFNETRVTPVSLIEQFLHRQRFLRAHETNFLPGL